MSAFLKEMIKMHIEIASADPLGKTPSAIYRLGRNLMRKNNTRAQAIATLNLFEKMSDSALEITRNMLEDVLSYGYILSDSDPEKQANKFFEFRWIQAKQDYDYHHRLGYYKDPDNQASVKKIKTEFDRVMEEFPEFKSKDGTPANSWSKDGIDGMAKTLVKRKIYNKDDMRNILRMYQKGSRKTHFNPEDILNYADQASWDESSFDAACKSLLTAAASLISLTIRYYYTVSYYDKKLYDHDKVKALYDLQQKIQKT